MTYYPPQPPRTGGILSMIGALALIGLGAGGGLAWDRHPAWGVQTPRVPLVGWRVGFDLPDSLATERDKARASLLLAMDATLACRDTLTAQSASIRSVAAEAAVNAASAAHALQSARSVAESYRQASLALKDYVPEGSDQCARWTDADRAVVKAMKP